MRSGVAVCAQKQESQSAIETMRRVLITGPARSGTTLLLLISRFFSDCYAYVDCERHPLHNNPPSNAKYTIIKHPYGYDEFKPRYCVEGLLQDNWRVIMMMRDPRDTLVSYNAKEKDRGHYWCKPESWLRSAKTFKQHYVWSQVLEQLPSDQTFYGVFYEDLVEFPHVEIKKIAIWLGVKLKPEWEDFYANESAKKWKTLNGARPIDTKSIGAWKDPKHYDYLRKVITPEMIDLAIELGYDDDWDILFP